MKAIKTININGSKYIKTNIKTNTKARKEKRLKTIIKKLKDFLVILGITLILSILTSIIYNWNLVGQVEAKELSTSNYCQNLYARGNKELLEENNCDIDKLYYIINDVKNGKY